MKKAFVSLLFLLAIHACSISIEKEAQKRIEQFIKTNAHDPKSYEFIGLDSTNRFSISDSIEFQLSKDSFLLDVALGQLKHAKFMEETYLSSDYTRTAFADEIKNYRLSAESYEKDAAKTKELIKQSVFELERLKKYPHENKLVKETFILHFRIKNLMGAYFKTSAKIDYYPQKGTWGTVQMAPNPVDGN